MPEKRLICPGRTLASAYAAEYLRDAGWSITSNNDPSVGRILLDVPSFGPGRMEKPKDFFSSLSKETTVYGGNLDHPTLEGFQKTDLLQDEYYLAANAAITARCAIEIAAPLLDSTYQNLPVLIIGWGRIGKCLGKLLQNAGADVVFAARKDSDLAILQALGYHSVVTNGVWKNLHQFRLIFNTVPAPVLTEKDNSLCRNCVKIDLASKKGIAGEDVVWARGLPGKYAPESSGVLIAKTFLRLVKEETL